MSQRHVKPNAEGRGDAFAEAAYAESLERVAAEARAMVRMRAGLCAGAAAAALPGLDFFVDAASLASLFSDINRRFQLAPEDIAKLHQAQRTAVYEAIAQVGAHFAGRSVTGAVALAALKQLGARWLAGKAAGWVPIAGRGAAAGLSFWAVKTLGEAHIRECVEVRRLAPAPLLLG